MFRFRKQSAAARIPAVPPAYGGFDRIDPAKSHFLVIGDTQNTSKWEFWRERNGRERQLVIDEVIRREPAFVLHLGDLTTRGSSRKHWRIFDALHAPLLAKGIPYFPIIGNHELYGNDRIALDHFFGRFPHLERRRWYSFAWKGVGFILLDSNFNTLSPAETEALAAWYRERLAEFERDPAIAFVIACCHKPPFTNSRVVLASKHARDRFADPFRRAAKTCLFFSGHSHTYERFHLDGKHFVVSGGGGGPRHRVRTRPTRRRFADVYAGPALRFFHACEVEVAPEALHFRVLRLDPARTFSPVDPLVIGRQTGP